jgi:putative membrane protein
LRHRRRVRPLASADGGGASASARYGLGLLKRRVVEHAPPDDGPIDAASGWSASNNALTSCSVRVKDERRSQAVIKPLGKRDANRGSRPLSTGNVRYLPTVTPVVVGSAILILLGVPAYSQSITEKSGVNSTLGITPTTQDFVTLAANSDMLEIQSSQLAATKSDNKDKAFAEHMIKDHTATSQKVKALVDSGKVKATLPHTMDSAHQAKLDKLKAVSGKEFSKHYEEMQVSAHQDAVSLFERYGKGGDNAELKTFANDTLPKLQEHLKWRKIFKSEA